jgi:hypothetical protein
LQKYEYYFDKQNINKKKYSAKSLVLSFFITNFAAKINPKLKTYKYEEVIIRMRAVDSSNGLQQQTAEAKVKTIRGRQYVNGCFFKTEF